MSFILFVNGLLTAAGGAVSLAVGLFSAQTRGVFLEAGLILLLSGTLLCLTNPPDLMRFRPRHAFLLTSSVWVTAAVAGAVPLWLWGLDFTDAFFESMSGITTTGSTVMTGLQDTPHGVLLWRALLQWAGGVGFIVTGIALLPILRVGGMQLFRSESSERGDRELTSAARFAGATLWVYLGLTGGAAVIYDAGGMDGFDAVVHAMASVSTGGFSTSDSSFGQFGSPFLHWAGTVFMLAGALPFAWYIRATRRGQVRSEQVVALALALGLTIGALTFWRVATSEATPFGALTDVAFNVVSVVTTTGFATTDYTLWGPAAVAAFFVLTFMGGCTGSTSGGIKTMRWIVLARAIRAQIRRIHAPSGVFPVTYEGKPLTLDERNGIVAFFSVFFLTFTALAALLSLLGLDPLTAISGALTALTNVGPGVGPVIGPAGTFQSLPDAAKWVLSFGMYAGRLEIFTVLVLLRPDFWREFA